MAIRLHGSARTTPGIRSGLRLATGSHRSLAKLYGINPKTAAKWRSRTSVLDAPLRSSWQSNPASSSRARTLGNCAAQARASVA